MSTGKVKVNIAVAVAHDETWSACGSSDRDDWTASRLALMEVGPEAVVHFVEAELRVPAGVTVTGALEPEARSA